MSMAETAYIIQHFYNVFNLNERVDEIEKRTSVPMVIISEDNGDTTPADWPYGLDYPDGMIWFVLEDGYIYDARIAHSNDFSQVYHIPKNLDEIGALDIFNLVDQENDGGAPMGIEARGIVPPAPSYVNSQDLIDALSTIAVANQHAIDEATIQVVTGEPLNDSILEKAEGLPIGAYLFFLGGNHYTGNDLPNTEYIYSTANVYVRGPGSAIVVLIPKSGSYPLVINHYDTDSWSGWKEYGMEANCYLFQGGIKIPENADLQSQTYLIPGNYYCNSNTTAETLINCPIDEAFLLKVELSTGDDNRYVRQTFIGHSKNNTIVRSLYNYGGEHWYPEVSYANSNNIDFKRFDESVIEVFEYAESLLSGDGIKMVYINTGYMGDEWSEIPSYSHGFIFKNNDTVSIVIWDYLHNKLKFTNRSRAGTWKNWSTCVDDQDIESYYSFNKATDIPSGSDLNDYDQFGNYISIAASITNTLLNCPVTGSGFTLHVERITGSISYCKQRLVFNSAVPREYWRTKVEGVWGSWYKIEGVQV